MLKAPPPLWALALLAAFYFLSDLPVFRDLPHWSEPRVGGLFAAIGLTLMFVAIGQFFSAKTQISPTSENNDALVVRGVYRLTRNPMYLGVVTASLGAALWFGRPLMLLAPLGVFLITNLVLIPYEEAKMRRQFGETYDAYCRDVRRWI